MKLLLTSSGIQNVQIAKALLDLVGKPAKDIALLYIPTAANVISGDKQWIIENLKLLQMQGYASIDILDIAAVPKCIWQPRFEAADVLCFGGGNEQYLARIMQESGVVDFLPEYLNIHVLMGISAGSMIAGDFPPFKILSSLYPDDQTKGEIGSPLKLVNLYFIPHLNSDDFPEVRESNLTILKDFTQPTYALGDGTALKIINSQIEIVGEQEYIKL